MSDASSTILVICVLTGGLVAVAALLTLSSITKGKNRAPSGRIPPAQSYYLDQEEAMARVRHILSQVAVVGCRWRITYDRAGEGRLQARVYGTPTGATGSEPVDILLNMLFHKIEAKLTELEWSYVVMSGKSEDADLLVNESNRSFKESLSSGQAGEAASAQ